MKKTFFHLVTTLIFIFVSCLSSHAQKPPVDDSVFGACAKVPAVFKQLTASLVKDGFDQEEICRIFSHPSVRFNPKVMPRKVTHKEAALHYEKFLEKSRIKRAKKYLERNRHIFDEVEKEYGIPKEVKVAILLVETDLGRYLGSDLALNNLASMAVASDLNKVKSYLPASYKHLSPKERAKLQKRLKSKSKWAYSELKSLIIYSKTNGLDIHKIKGSIFGAIGLCQFMPSNALKFGVDFNKDGKVDLFDPADAIASMANYLQHYGWKPDLKRVSQIKVIKHYNHSTPYANTVLEVAKKVGHI